MAVNEVLVRTRKRHSVKKFQDFIEIDLNKCNFKSLHYTAPSLEFTVSGQDVYVASENTMTSKSNHEWLDEGLRLDSKCS